MSTRNRTAGRLTLVIGLLAGFTLLAGCCPHARRKGRHHWKHGHMRGPCGCKGGKHMKGHFGMMGHGRRGFKGHGKMGFGKMGRHKKGMMFKFLIHSKMLKAKLGLTADQINKLKALHKKHKESMRAYRLKKRRAKAKVMVELLKDKPDVAKLRQLHKPVLEAKTAKMQAKLDMKISFIQIFTPDQWRKIISSRWFRMGHHGGRGRKGMGHHGGWGAPRNTSKARSWAGPTGSGCTATREPCPPVACRRYWTGWAATLNKGRGNKKTSEEIPSDPWSAV
jgi:Spy/CpxP family protein refolding chaperone